MRILWLNWRDLCNPAAGGAEIVTHQVALRWVQQGHAVTLFTANFPGGAAEETIDGVRILRQGKQFSVHYHAWRYYRRVARGNVDVVIDEINTIPFFTPLYVQERKIAFFHQLARQVWLYESRFPLNVVGYCLEPLYLRFYRHTPTVVISESTQQDLLDLGSSHVSVVHVGGDISPLAMVPSEGEKASRPTIVYLGRLVPSKRVADIVEATALLRAELPEIQLWLVGDGTRDYIRRLHDLVARHNLSENVRFWGKVSQARKCDLLKQAHVFAMTSVREGWGLVILEANAFGTPAVVYDVHGLRDSVRDGETGLVCKTNTPPTLAVNLKRLLTDHELHARLAHGALEWSRCFTWDKNADDMMRILQDLVRPAK